MSWSVTFASSNDGQAKRLVLPVNSGEVNARCSEAHRQMHEEYEESFRVLLAAGAEHVMAQADGTLIRTVEPGTRSSRVQPPPKNEIRRKMLTVI